MSVRGQLQALRDTLPTTGSIVLNREALDEILCDEKDTETALGNGPDFTVREIAERFGRSPQTVRDWIKSGKLQAYQFNGREYRVTNAALAEFEERQRQRRDRKPPCRGSTDLRAWRRV